MQKVFIGLISVVVAIVLSFGLCACDNKKGENIDLPADIDLVANKSQPLLKVYDKDAETIVEMQMEEYLLGVLAGEIYNDWPLEALKAQAILARTYTLYFIQNNQSKYEGADISTDITEAQAYNKDNINDNIKKAVEETKGLVVMKDGQLIETYFHSNSGGVTTTAKNGLNYASEDNFSKMVSSPENEENSENFSWTASFTKAEVLSALREMGVSVVSASSMAVGEKDESGRAKTLVVSGTEFDANTFRLKIGSTKMKSTLIEDIVVGSTKITMSGKGYGHGVGMSQWGAKILAEQGKTAEEIVEYYFNDIVIELAKFE